MTDILILGEMLVEIMRYKENIPLYEQGIFLGPYPSGAPAICIDTAARLGCSTAILVVWVKMILENVFWNG